MYCSAAPPPTLTDGGDDTVPETMSERGAKPGDCRHFVNLLYFVGGGSHVTVRLHRGQTNESARFQALLK